MSGWNAIRVTRRSCRQGQTHTTSDIEDAPETDPRSAWLSRPKRMANSREILKSSWCVEASPKTHLVADDEEVVLQGKTGDFFQLLKKTREKHTHKHTSNDKRGIRTGYNANARRGVRLCFSPRLFCLHAPVFTRLRILNPSPERKVFEISFRACVRAGTGCGWVFEASRGDGQLSCTAP